MSRGTCDDAGSSCSQLPMGVRCGKWNGAGANKDQRVAWDLVNGMSANGVYGMNGAVNGESLTITAMAATAVDMEGVMTLRCLKTPVSMRLCSTTTEMWAMEAGGNSTDSCHQARNQKYNGECKTLMNMLSVGNTRREVC